MELKNKTIYFLGDSITEGACATKFDNVYHQVASRLLGARSAVDGISGTRIAKQVKPSDQESFDRSFTERFSECKDTYDFAVIFGGVNDFGHGDAPFGCEGDNTADTFIGAVDLLCRLVKERYGKNAAFILPLHNTFEDDPRGQTSIKPVPGNILAEYRRVINDAVRKYEIDVLDLWDAEGFDPNLDSGSGSFADGLHPNDEGHRMLGERVAEFLKGL